MADQKKNYSVFNMGSFADLEKKEINGKKGKVFLGQELGLTGCEASINSTPAGGFTPFVHSHKMNEELYIVIKGSGFFYVDGEEFPIREGSMIRVAPAGERAIKAGDEGLSYACVQVQQGSLKQATKEDGVITETKTSWM